MTVASYLELGKKSDLKLVPLEWFLLPKFGSESYETLSEITDKLFVTSASYLGARLTKLQNQVVWINLMGVENSVLTIGHFKNFPP